MVTEMLQKVNFLSVFLFLKICYRGYCHNKNQSLTFAAIGDFGGTPFPPFYTIRQKKVAKVMGEYADIQGVKFVIGLGDNFYSRGVRTVDDPRFTTTFEHVYTSPALKAATWYMIAGNHDHASNVSAQIAYTKISPRWHFSDFFYTKVLKIPGTSQTVQLVLIDTTMLCCRDLLTNLTKFPSQQDQLTWINETLRNSSADYLIVAGHHPVFSAGVHGNTKYLESNLKPLLEENNVSVYLSGHDHNSQHLKEDNSNVNYFVSGAGSKLTGPWLEKHLSIVTTKLKFFNGYYGAFTLFDATPEFLTITQINENGKELNKAKLTPRNSRNSVVSSPRSLSIAVLLALVGIVCATGFLCALRSTKAREKLKIRKIWTRVPEESSQESEPEN